MGLSEKLEKLVRIIPGVAGYQDNEASRDTDKAVRLKLSSELEQIKQDIETVKKSLADRMDLTDKKDLLTLPALDRITSKLGKTCNLVTYASRGFSGIFDAVIVERDRLDRLYAFDLSLFDEVSSVRAASREVRESLGEGIALKKALQKMETAVDGFEKLFSTRQEILTTK